MQEELPPQFSPGMIVVSLKGHDQGRLYLVLAQKGETRLLLADGLRHGYVDAKLKNTKHVQKLGRALDEKDLEEIISSEQCESECNAAIRKMIAAWSSKRQADTQAIGGVDAERRSN
ncbi:MAG: hypothetical protein WDA02_09810 [Saccharofermentanales bacterium]